ncbi:TetR/AcrR family transcriptional regulator [Amycolatopsis pithecellobii]|uniref:TetR family transcriptional regulator n=1 Tax=Amycolatopsis pithecellobii TaxID=664692 RepID=A0A6N7YJI7_9PSEU|nr:TetR/AcrR family transcriptional regulator [Amycolatopsis pithecellobii]MTD53075.1 TetR family transcriptional regulator [Amycolatopsis pithecellobii]
MTKQDAPKRRTSGGAVLRQGVTEAIEAAAFAELGDNGYARTSMDAIARRAGVGKAALYRRWPSKEAMLTDLIGHAVRGSLPPAPDTGALRTDLREMLGRFRDQLGNPLVSRIGLGLLAEAAHSAALNDALQELVAVPRRAAARRLVEAAIDRGELPAELDAELAMDLLVAPLGLRMLVMGGQADDTYLETLARAIEAALRAAVPPERA